MTDSDRFTRSRTTLQSTIAMFALDGVLVAAPLWALVTCRCREPEGMLLAAEFDLRLAIATAADGFPCGVMKLHRLPDEVAILEPQGHHD